MVLTEFVFVPSSQDPPSFLFDSIAPGWNRRLGGFFLWIHVVVSYAINSQAICSSMDRLFFHRVMPNNAQRRWMILTLGVSVSSYLVANAVPFFKDLVSLIGALTSIPLTLMIPAIFFRRTWANHIVWRPDLTWSFALLLFATIFTLTGLVGAVRLTQMDWMSHGPPFSCY